MPTTEPTYGWRLPTPPDPPDVPKDMANLAHDIAASIQTGTESFTLSGQSRKTGTVTFPVPFAAPPVVVVSSELEQWNTNVRNITTTSFETGVRHIENTTWSVTVEVTWIAVGRVA